MNKEDKHLHGYSLGYRLTKVDQDRIIRILLRMPINKDVKNGIQEGVLRWKLETDVLADNSRDISKQVHEFVQKQTNTDMNKQEETEYIKMFNDGYNLMKSGQEKLLEMLTGMTTPQTTFHEALKDAKAEWEFEQQLAHEMEEEYSRKKKELKRAMDQNRNQNNIER